MIHKANSDNSLQPGPSLETIRDQHRHILELFERYLATPADSRRAIVDEILQRLMSHLKSEESQFYITLRQTGPRGVGLVEAALSEHEEITAMIEEIQNSETDDDQALDEFFEDMMQTVRMHFEVEEREMFPIKPDLQMRPDHS